MKDKKDNSVDRSEAKTQYKQAKRPMGVYRIRNTKNGKSYVGFSTDIQARINRHKFELKVGSDQNTELLGEWKSFGESAFAFEVLDELKHDENSTAKPGEELSILADMWIRKLEDAGDSVIRL